LNQTQCLVLTWLSLYLDVPFSDMTPKIDSFLQNEAQQGPFALIIGHPVQQSLSPEMHKLAALHHQIDFRYHRLDLSPEELHYIRLIMDHPHFRGANITVPHKIDVAQYLDDLADEAHIIGAVNTIILDGNRKIGYNTDAYGFAQPLKKHQKRLHGGKAIIFGTGGATRAIVYALNMLGVDEIWLVARQPHTIMVSDFFASKNIRTVSYTRWAKEVNDVDLIINATPLGMVPDTDSCPIEEADKDALIGKIVYDIVYKPIETKLLRLAQQVMADTIDGLGMLVHQGSRAFELWNGLPFPVELVDAHLRNILNERV
jgi:shikimate dehydrogenase